MTTSGPVDAFQFTKTCEVCRNRQHAKWHDLARGDINPVALVEYIEALPQSSATQAIIGYVMAVTGVNYKEMKEVLANER